MILSFSGILNLNEKGIQNRILCKKNNYRINLITAVVSMKSLLLYSNKEIWDSLKGFRIAPHLIFLVVLFFCTLSTS